MCMCVCFSERDLTGQFVFVRCITHSAVVSHISGCTSKLGCILVFYF